MLAFAAVRGEAAPPQDEIRVSLVYTGRSLGALGVLRAQDEHELLTEQANAEKVPFRLVSHACWRAPGAAVVTPSGEPEGDELPRLLAARAGAERREDVRALRTNNVLLVQDPWREGPDLLAMLRRNPRAHAFFPDLVETRVSLTRVRVPGEERALIVEERGHALPLDAAGFGVGELNRVDVQGARLYELPVNLGEIGPRATLLARAREAARDSQHTLLVDLGEREGDLGVERAARARLDWTALQRLGYSLVVPFEFELALGASALRELRDGFAPIGLLAANVKAAREPELLQAHRIVEVAGLRIGLFGVVDPDVRGQLPRATLADYVFEPPLDAALREARALRQAGADAVIALSNLHPRDNAVLARDVPGIDAIVADLHVRWSPESLRTEVVLPDRPFSRPGSPALVARGFANGLGVGRLELRFRPRPEGGGHFLSSLEHRLDSVTDRTPADAALVADLQAMANSVRRPRGELLVPAFADLVARRSGLAAHDDTTAQGRISKRMWEEFLARLLRNRGRAEVAIVRKLPHFPPLIGKLHEQEVRSWLWTEDQLVLLDLQGLDLKKILLEDARGDLVLSGIDRKQWTVMGRRLDEAAFYRVATTDVLFEGARFRDFEKARRVRRRFRVAQDGALNASRAGSALGLREFVLGELRRLRSRGSAAQLERLSAWLAPDLPYENLLTFRFDQPTLWVSANRVYNNDAYGAVPESRVTSADSWVSGLTGRFRLSHDRKVFATDLGTVIAYSRQSARDTAGLRQVTESADDFKLDLTLRPKTAGRSAWKVQPFLRGLVDSEFTQTVNPTTRLQNPRQLAVRGTGGALFAPRGRLRSLELGLALENDLNQRNFQIGFQGKAELVKPFGPLGRLQYRLRNDASYFLPGRGDGPSHLALRYSMVHELLIPLVDELSLSVAADVFVFKGKVESTRRPGAGVLLRVGLTYDRLWKPRYQPLF